MKAWDEMTEPRQRDEQIAIHLFGWTWYTRGLTRWLAPTGGDDNVYPASDLGEDADLMVEERWWLGDSPPFGDTSLHVVPHYTTNAVAEASVLAVVKKWNDSRQWRFIQAMAELLRVRDTDFTTFGTMHLVLLGNGDAPGLCVGMISRAAYETLRQEAGQ